MVMLMVLLMVVLVAVFSFIRLDSSLVAISFLQVFSETRVVPRFDFTPIPYEDTRLVSLSTKPSFLPLHTHKLTHTHTHANLGLCTDLLKLVPEYPNNYKLSETDV